MGERAFQAEYEVVGKGVVMRRANYFDAEELAHRISAGDQAEADALVVQPLDGIMRGIEQSGSDCWALFDDSGCLGIFGCADQGDYASPWFIHTERFRQYPRTAIELGRRMIEEWLEKYGRIENVCLATNESALGFIEAIGMELGERTTFADTGKVFVKFGLEV